MDNGWRKNFVGIWIAILLVLLMSTISSMLS